MDVVKNATELLCEVHRHRTAGFSGLGVIFYQSAADLPVIGLGHGQPFPYRLPVCGIPAIAEVLAAISDKASQFHDGFHLVDAPTNCLTQVSQFVSPPLPDTRISPLKGWPPGARQMTAQLASGLSAVAAVGLLSGDEVAVYESTQLVVSIKLKSA